MKSFLEWWDENCEKDGNSVLLPDSENAIRIMTVHKAKGLQFPVVLIPFFNWKIMPPLETIFWTSSDAAPFSDVKKIPVRFGASLENTVFKDHYSEETRNYMADAFNMIYVAFTRAMERMYIFSPAAKLPVDEFKNAKDILVAAVSEMSGAEELTEFIAGEKSSPDKNSKRRNVASIDLHEYISTEWRKKISIKEKNSLQSSMVKEQMKKIRYGSVAHRILSSLKTIDDLEPELNKIFYEGVIDEQSKLDLRNQIEKLFENDTIKDFFSLQWSSMTEREILLPDGKILRPDRVLLKDNNAVVIDFKTGKEKPEDAMQVQSYADVLLRMNYKTVAKYLIYLEDSLLVPV